MQNVANDQNLGVGSSRTHSRNRNTSACRGLSLCWRINLIELFNIIKDHVIRTKLAPFTPAELLASAKSLPFVRRSTGNQVSCPGFALQIAEIRE